MSEENKIDENKLIAQRRKKLNILREQNKALPNCTRSAKSIR